MAETRTTSSTGGQKGVKLARFDLIPAGPLKELAEHYGRGARKYANHQWRQGYEWSKSIAALARHFNDFMAGYDYDVCSNDPDGCRHTDMDGNPFDTGEPDTCFNHTGSHHMAAVAWHSFLLLEFKDTHKAFDDRYGQEPILDFDEIAAEIVAGRGSILSPAHWDEVRLLADEDPVSAPDVDPYDRWMHPALPGDIQQQVGTIQGFQVQLRSAARGQALAGVQRSLNRRG